MQVHIYTTGGTIDKIYFDAKSTFEVGDPQVIEVLREANVTIEIQVTPLMRKDSLDMNDDDRALIHDAIAADPCAHIVITHGTDSMAITAQALVDIPDKTMVFTGAMQPAKFRMTDAVFNIASAITASQTLPPGVYIAMNGQVFEAGKVRKNVAENRFEAVG
ncbi:MAG: asparaginase [Caldilineaceae bacterium]|nr:asparaginase [Caldilineaceae bacterium]MBP8110307.1 asparaginase [Caldilineaceae bacterium]MBP8124776.1 asparaginase [Caldilineaceae bacterium]MBP9074225.1 asparaginase [Caldilineaceae bacterium]